MEKILFIFWVTLPAFLHAQDKATNARLGVGAVTIGVYAHDKEHDLNDDGNLLVKEAQMQKIQYYMNDQVIFRDFADQSSDSSRISGISTDSTASVKMNVTIKDDKYLIKLDSSLLYYYHYKNNKIEKIIRYPLDSCTFEYFYRSQRNPLRIVSLEDTAKIVINNIPCFKGEGVEAETGKPITFYYHKNVGKFRSPLNTYFNSDFRYNVIRIRFSVEWTYNGAVIPDGGYLIFQVERYNEDIPDQKLFTLPAGISVVENIPFSQIILENFNEFKDNQISN